MHSTVLGLQVWRCVDMLHVFSTRNRLLAWDTTSDEMEDSRLRHIIIETHHNAAANRRARAALPTFRRFGAAQTPGIPLTT